MSHLVNIAHGLKQTARKHPYKRAVVFPSGRDGRGRVQYSQVTFSQLDKKSDRLAFGLEKAGVIRGTRTILMVTPSIEFFYIIFAMFKTGAVPVVVDPGMGLERMLECFSRGKPRAFIGIEKAHVLRRLRPRFFKSIRTWITVGSRWFWGGYNLDKLFEKTDRPYSPARTPKSETAAIVFTTGSTGPAKGVVYTHGNFDAQIRQISDHFRIGPDEIDLPTFPLFALFDPALAMTAVIPDMNPTKPARANPRLLIEAIEDHGVTNMFASPALLYRLGSYCSKNNIKLESLRRVVSAGAPVPPSSIELFSGILTQTAEIHTPYGATEAVPVISVTGTEILSETKSLSEKGFGTCIGRPIRDTLVKIIRITDDPITQLRDTHELPENEVGEIIVKSPVVTRHYFDDKGADLLAKIPDATGAIWHRMGDLAWKDKKGRFWFCGRKSHRVTTEKGPLYTIPCEAVFNNHKDVYRSALAGVGTKGFEIPVVFVEPHPEVRDKKALLKSLHEMKGASPLTEEIAHIFIVKSLPVDIRHNSKIFREKLAEKARKKLKIQSGKRS